MKELRNKDYEEIGGQNLVKHKIMRKKQVTKGRSQASKLTKAKSSSQDIFNRLKIPDTKKDLKSDAMSCVDQFQEKQNS